MTPGVVALVRFRLEQADEALRSAAVLLEQHLARPAVNRAYYAMFYAVLALLSAHQQSTSKHSGAIAALDRDYVKTGLLAKELSAWLHEAFDLRQRADYREMFQVSEERAKELLQQADTFVTRIKELLVRLSEPA